VPRSIKVFASLWVLTLALGVVQMVPMFTTASATAGGAAFVLTVWIFTYVIIVLLVWWAMYKNWGRLILLFMTVIGVAISSFDEKLWGGGPSSFIAFIQVVLQAIGLYFLFFPIESREWFRR
jgi:hypothetical protein